MFYENYIEKIYIVNGLARSGNHLFITWLISGFNNNEVYYLNNIKPSYYNLINEKKTNIKKIFNSHTITNDNKYGLKINEEIRKNLAGTKAMKKFLFGKKKIKILVISMENKKTEKIDILSKIFINCDNIYKCIVLRDILNLFSSRIESEKRLSSEDLYKTDKITIEYWLDNYYNSKKKDYIVFNYNKFLCYTITRKALSNKLNINYSKTKITLNSFGLTSGSSFQNNISNKSNYFMRWNLFKNNELVKNLINQKNIMKILCRDFSMCLNFNDKKIKICKNLYNLE